MLRLLNITFSCNDPERLAEFWATLLDYEAASAGDSWIATDPRGEGTRLLFNRMEKSETIEVPIHVDVNVPDREAELNRILQLGGQFVETRSDSIGDFSETWTVMRDPEGNGFCIQSPPKTPPHRYIGNVTFSCAEPRQLGAFWAEALGWPEEETDEGFLQQLRDAGVAERELSGCLRHEAAERRQTAVPLSAAGEVAARELPDPPGLRHRRSGGGGRAARAGGRIGGRDEGGREPHLHDPARPRREPVLRRVAR